MSLNRPEMYRFHNGGTKDTLPFADQEYHDRLEGLRDIMEMHELDAVVLTSMHNVAYYSGFLYCSFGRPYACVVTKTECVTISAPGSTRASRGARSIGDNITYTDWTRDNLWRVVASVTGDGQGHRLRGRPSDDGAGGEAEHLPASPSAAWISRLRRCTSG